LSSCSHVASRGLYYTILIAVRRLPFFIGPYQRSSISTYQMACSRNREARFFFLWLPSAYSRMS
jgi:hypothetical protein